MDKATIARLNAINRSFYQQTADAFDRTRGSPWPGWERLLPYLTTIESTPLDVLDVGCGNGRFGVFLADRLSAPIQYHGIDNNTALLESAQAALARTDRITPRLETHDVVEAPLAVGNYDLVVAFGVLHHIPGYAERTDFVQRLAAHVKPGGLLAFAAWRFYTFERFQKRIIPWPADLADLVERHDYLLDWRHETRAQRYCHYVDEDEHQALLRATGLETLITYAADGATGTMNRYSVLHRPLDY